MIPDATTVYKCFDQFDTLLYVGITNQGQKRFDQHLKSKLWWPEITKILTEHYLTRSEAFQREAALIKELQPQYNLYPGISVEDPLWGTDWTVYVGGPSDGCVDVGRGDWRKYLWTWHVKPGMPMGRQLPATAYRNARYRWTQTAGRTHFYVFEDWGGQDDPTILEEIDSDGYHVIPDEVTAWMRT